MRRAQSVRHYARSSIALASDDLGMLREGTETDEDILRRQLIEKDRECDKLNTLVQTLQAQLAVRPPLEDVQALQKEYKNLELILSGTQRENERCMSELERVKQREKLLERKLCELVGENWQSSLDIPSVNTSLLGNPLQPIRSAGHHQRSHTISSSPVTTLSGMYSANRHSPSPSLRGGKGRRGSYYSHDNGSSASQDQVRDSLLEEGPDSPVTQRRKPQRRSRRGRDDDGDEDVDDDEEDDEDDDNEDSAERQREKEEQRAMLFSHIEQVKLLVLGMEQRLQTREGELKKNVDRAEREGGRFEVLRRELDSISVA
ncbi:hypothetical protein EST38_g2759 [Candolleomyces aberdarensis]|uniref:Uncharacterized protein n=1 Tax=Candolleomyces aberdarensis TaxID=2316362 RepID=A0A4Q2DTP6_9AGAR|nr:hypothetical protein EST38_g2759 [Candolleomyces aberdarensis]